MRTVKSFPLNSHSPIKHRMLAWAQRFDEVVWLDGNEYKLKYSSYRAVLAVEAFTAIKTSGRESFDRLEEYQMATADWLFGFLGYDLKNDVENLSSHNFDGLDFPDMYFFQPKRIFLLLDDRVEVHYLNLVADEIDDDWQQILQTIPIEGNRGAGLQMQPRTTKDEYLLQVQQMLKHIHRGDIYEVNLCQEFYCTNAQIDPLQSFTYLNSISAPPFAAFLKLESLFALCASPERFVKRKDATVISQPIKGTARRSPDAEEDKLIAMELGKDRKERSENIMIVDLVRNDLSRFAEKGSVFVEELCGVYSFPQVHQLISTVSCQVSKGISPVEILRNTFPMGSMTGAPKVSAMRLIESVEDAKRGLYSGSIGYFDPQGNFDFNVVIRSILYNSRKNYVSFSVGGAITHQSDPEKEYLECLLKAKAMRQVLE